MKGLGCSAKDGRVRCPGLNLLEEAFCDLRMSGLGAGGSDEVQGFEDSEGGGIAVS